jgi:uncharacterized protein YjiS (DUF1127 family)
MFKLLTFRSDGAFWPFAERDDNRARAFHLGRILMAWPRQLVAAVLRELSTRRARQTLASLDDRMLRDIGIDRSQIESVCRHGRQHGLNRLSDLRADLTRWS